MVTKERIVDRMMKTAARVWNIPENEIDSNFDPLFTLMLQACAAELERIDHSIHTSEERLMDYVANMLLPEVLIKNRPASCIIHTTAQEDGVMLGEGDHFASTQKITSPTTGRQQSKDLYFTPIGEFQLKKAELKYVFVEGTLYKTYHNFSRETVYGNNRNSTFQDIWLALDVDKSCTSLEHISLYLDLRKHTDARHLFQSMHLAQVQIAGEKALLHSGYALQQQFDMKMDDLLEHGHSYEQSVNRMLASIYSNNFFYIQGALNPHVADAKNMPAEWETHLPQAITEKIKGEALVYVKITLNRTFSTDMLGSINMAINAFPAVNRKKCTMTYRTDALINIIPLHVEDEFLDIDSIITSTGGQYRFRSSGSAKELDQGEAILKNRNVGKLNSIEVREIIQNLMEGMRDESAYFNELSNDFIAARLKEMNKIVLRLEDQISRITDKKPGLYYLLLKPRHVGEIVTINYWSMDGRLATMVKTGTHITSYQHTHCIDKDTCVITNNVGEKVKFSTAEKQTVLKQQLTSGGKIVTREDVKLLCQSIFGEWLKDVVIEKSFSMGTGRQDGFSRCILIKLQLSMQAQEGGEVEEYYINELYARLETHSLAAYPYKVVVEYS